MREAGDVCYADVYRDGSGVVEFRREQDLKYAVRVLDDTKFKSHEVMTGLGRCENLVSCLFAERKVLLKLFAP